jgi:HAD superfamily hydrolase (TIGR01509 family)
MKIQAIFWDYDNTILATANAHFDKHKTVLSTLGITLGEEHRETIYKNNGYKNWEWMNAKLGLNLPQEQYLQKVDAEFQKHMINLEMRPGVQHLFDLIATKDLPQAIITNARTDSAKPVLEAKKITDIMKFVLYKEDYTGSKPAPEPYLKGMAIMAEKLGKPIEAGKCIAIEDDANGVESAKKAGAIVVHRKLSENDIDSPFADYTCYHEKDFIEIMESLLQEKTTET